VKQKLRGRWLLGRSRARVCVRLSCTCIRWQRSLLVEAAARLEYAVPVSMVVPVAEVLARIPGTSCVDCCSIAFSLMLVATDDVLCVALCCVCQHLAASLLQRILRQGRPRRQLVAGQVLTARLIAGTDLLRDVRDWSQKLLLGAAEDAASGQAGAAFGLHVALAARPRAGAGQGGLGVHRVLWGIGALHALAQHAITTLLIFPRWARGVRRASRAATDRACFAAISVKLPTACLA